MSSVRKNVLVAVTVLGALAAVGWMIVQFGGTLGGLVGGGGYRVMMRAPRVDGLSEGNRVQYLGLSVGKVESIRLDDTNTAFEVVLLIRKDSGVPQNVEGVVRATNLISGGAAIDLQLVGDTAEGGQLGTGDRVIDGAFGGADLIPPEIAVLAEEVRNLVAELRSSGLVDEVQTQVAAVGELANSLNALVGDEQLRADVKEAVAGARRTVELAERSAFELQQIAATANERAGPLFDEADGVLADARAVAGDVRGVVRKADATVADVQSTVGSASSQVDEILGDLRTSTAQANAALSRVNAIAAKIDQGEGTLGLLINDPQVYRALNTDLILLEDFIKDTRRLVNQIEEEGVSVGLFN